MIIIAVSDEGYGISKNDIKYIFEPYYKLQMQRKNNVIQSAGLGLGLSICKLICKSLSGDIRVQSSKLRSGSMFEFTMSCQKDAFLDDSENISIDMS